MICSRCGEDQDRDQFGPSADLWPDRRECKACARTVAQVRKHGLSAADRVRIAERQGGCRICGHPEPGPKGWVVDHDRSCCPGDRSCPKCRRGVLCQYCNAALGFAFDRPQILKAAARYLAAVGRSHDWHAPIECAARLCGTDAPSNAPSMPDAIHGENGENELTGAGPLPPAFPPTYID